MNPQPATVGTTDEEIDAAIAEASAEPADPVAVSAEYSRDFDMVIVRLDTGDRLLIPREQMQGLENATPEQLSHIQIFAGVDIAWVDLDVDHYLPHLLEGEYATERWKQARKQQQVAA